MSKSKKPVKPVDPKTAEALLWLFSMKLPATSNRNGAA